jgi:hypothetical protein
MEALALLGLISWVALPVLALAYLMFAITRNKRHQ